MTWPTNRWPVAQELLDWLAEIGADARFAGLCTVTDSPNATPVLAVKSNFIRIGKGSGGAATRASVVFVGGHHAREWVPPTALTNLVSLLLETKVSGGAITIGSATFGPGDIDAIFENVDLYVLPLANPDGYDFSQQHDTGGPTSTRGWRKNRRPPPSPMPVGVATCVPNPADPADPPIGVDVNRNYDVLWDFENFYITTPQNSKDPCQIDFIGSTTAFSEAESQNVKALLDLADPQFYVDVHMSGGTIMHAWGTWQNGEVPDPTPPLNQTKIRDASFKESIGTNFLATIQATANLMADGTDAATGNRYDVAPGADSAPIAGASDDYATSRNLGTAKPPIEAFTLECGKHFLPDFASEFPGVQKEVHTALLALLRMAGGPMGTSSGHPSCLHCHC